MKKNAGVSIIEIVISIIILLMIAFLAILASKDSIPKAQLTEVYSEMCAVKQAVDTIQTNLIMIDNYTIQQDVHYDAVLENGNYVIYGSLDEEHIPKAASNLGLEDLKRNYEVNYETGEIALVTPIDIKGTSIRTIQDAEELLNSNTI